MAPLVHPSYDILEAEEESKFNGLHLKWGNVTDNQKLYSIASVFSLLKTDRSVDLLIVSSLQHPSFSNHKAVPNVAKMTPHQRIYRRRLKKNVNNGKKMCC
jgi:hypothetical protein